MAYFAVVAWKRTLSAICYGCITGTNAEVGQLQGLPSPLTLQAWGLILSSARDQAGCDTCVPPLPAGSSKTISHGRPHCGLLFQQASC